jgi:hypothetical protein
MDEAKMADSRSGRPLLRPLEFWRLERPVYEGGGVTGVERVLSPPAVVRKRKASRRTAAAADTPNQARPCCIYVCG